MSAQDLLRHVIDQERGRLHASVPGAWRAAMLALLRIQDRAACSQAHEPIPDLITGRRLANLGGKLALQLCFETSGSGVAESPVRGDQLDGWAERFLRECGQVAAAEVVLAHCETGFMRLLDAGDGTLHAWIATRRAPATWRERVDIDWWASWLARRHDSALRALRSQRPAVARADLAPSFSYSQLAAVYLKMMSYQLGYPPDAVIGGCSIGTYRDVLGWLIGAAMYERDRGEGGVPHDERDLIAAIAADLDIDPNLAGRAVSAFTVDRESAAYHAAVPGVAAAPLVRFDANQVVYSVHGLTTEPLFFLTRELRRRGAEEYHNTAHLREAVFRQDLYALFPDKRFVTSAGRIELRRDSGAARTDVDAVIFDRKTGTLGLFELKSHDPFARSTAELARQRDNVLFANRQVSGTLSWLQRHSADALLSRFDTRTARTFRVQKIYPFVLGRYLAQFNDGPQPDRRAAWGAWPQVLRLLDGQPAGGSNHLAALFTRLTRDTPVIVPPASAAPQEVTIGDLRLVVHPSYAAFHG